ncbi:MAG: cytochrome c oxidase assembly protein [Jatrophihabitans sp.]
MVSDLATGPAASTPPRRRAPWFEIVCTLLGAAVLAVVAVIVYRSQTAPHSPVLPVSWCRTGSMQSLPPLLGSALLTQWHLDPIALVVVGLAAMLYLAGVRIAGRDGAGRWSTGRTVGFLAGLVVCVLATNASIAVYDMALFTAHMVGHLMLVMLAPVLLCVGRPMELLLRATGEPWRGRLTRLIRGRVASLVFSPPVALASYATVIVGSHLTGAMDEIMRRPWAGQLEHLVYVLVGFQFFTLLVGDDSIRWQLTTPARWMLLAISMAVDTFTGVVLMMTARPIAMVAVPGLPVNQLSDTHSGGAIMWVGGDGLMASVMIALTIAFLRRPAMRELDRTGWMEQVRQSVFAGNVADPADAVQASPPAAVDADFDDQERNRERYNRWLAKMAEADKRVGR